MPAAAIAQTHRAAFEPVATKAAGSAPPAVAAPLMHSHSHTPPPDSMPQTAAATAGASSLAAPGFRQAAVEKHGSHEACGTECNQKDTMTDLQGGWVVQRGHVEALAIGQSAGQCPTACALQ